MIWRALGLALLFWKLCLSPPPFFFFPNHIILPTSSLLVKGRLTQLTLAGSIRIPLKNMDFGAGEPEERHWWTTVEFRVGLEKKVPQTPVADSSGSRPA